MSLSPLTMSRDVSESRLAPPLLSLLSHFFLSRFRPSLSLPSATAFVSLDRLCLGLTSLSHSLLLADRLRDGVDNNRLLGECLWQHHCQLLGAQVPQDLVCRFHPRTHHHHLRSPAWLHGLLPNTSRCPPGTSHLHIINYLQVIS